MKNFWGNITTGQAVLIVGSLLSLALLVNGRYSLSGAGDTRVLYGINHWTGSAFFCYPKDGKLRCYGEGDKIE